MNKQDVYKYLYIGKWAMVIEGTITFFLMFYHLYIGQTLGAISNATILVLTILTFAYICLVEKHWVEHIEDVSEIGSTCKVDEKNG